MRKFIGKVIFILTLSSMLCSCSVGNQYSIEQADAIIDAFEESQNIVSEDKEVIYSQIDCNWDLFDEFCNGDVARRMIGVMSQIITAEQLGYKPQSMLVTTTSDGEEWYYNYNEYNTMKCCVDKDNTYSLEIYYCNPNNTLVSNEIMDVYSDTILLSLPEIFKCNSDDIVTITSQNGDITHIYDDNEITIYISDESLLSIKYSVGITEN